ncbi:MAG: AarF/ABC1/UbiB kinase family protein [Myxococcales bacterium]|nr:AarF/ABC1/UbiB kinase family protein [Myxococcales bacterium]
MGTDTHNPTADGLDAPAGGHETAKAPLDAPVGGHETALAPLDALAQGFRQRTWSTAKLAMKAGFAALGKTLRPNSKHNGVDVEKARRAALAMVSEMERLKGLTMKFGQMASYLNASLPPEAQQALATLQSQSQPMSWAAASGVIEEELGQAAEEAFDEIETSAFAAASLGQVHRARLGERRLAVKIQYPGIQAATRSDLKTVGGLARLALLFGPLPGGQLVEELGRRVLEECDYRREAHNQLLFAELLAEIPGASVPGVCLERSAGRVLSSDLVEGMDFQRFAATADQARKDEAGKTIFGACLDTVFRHAVFNADPHPGNYLFTDEGVCFLDFGCVLYYSGEFIARWKRLARSILEDDRAGFRDALVDAGLVKTTRGFDWDEAWHVFNHVYVPFKSPTPYRFTKAYVMESYDVMVWQNKNMMKSTVPREWLFLNRLQWGLNSVLAELDASARWGDLVEHALAQPTSPIPAPSESIASAAS